MTTHRWSARTWAMTIVVPMLLILLTGCLNFDQVVDRMPQSVKVAGIELSKSEEDPFFVTWLQLDYKGNLTLNRNLLNLPRAQEDVRCGIHLVDLDALPVQWRPPHAKSGGAMVSWLAEGSPLAVAGLRPFDVILECAPYKVEKPQDFLQIVADKPDYGTLRIRVQSRDGERQVKCDLYGPYRNRSCRSFPFLFYWLRSPLHEVSSVPFLYTDELETMIEYDTRSQQPVYVTYTRKSLPLELVAYENRRENGSTDAETTTLTILWFLKFDLGD